MKQVAVLLLSAFLESVAERVRQLDDTAAYALHHHVHHHLRQTASESDERDLLTKRHHGSPELDAAIAEAKEVSRLSDKIQRVELEISEWRRRYAQAKAFHEGQMDSLKEQIKIRKEQNSQNTDELDGYKEKKKKHYKYLMCSYVLDGFFFGDEDKKLHILHLCMGRETLAHFHAHGNSSHHHRKYNAIGNRHLVFWDSITTERLDDELSAIDNATSALHNELLVFATHCGHRCKARGPVEQMRARLRELETERDTIKAEYYRDKAKWKRERDELNAQEDALGNNVYESHHEKAALRKEAWAEVKSDFCPVINEHYGINEDEIVDYATVECQKD